MSLFITFEEISYYEKLLFIFAVIFVSLSCEKQMTETEITHLNKDTKNINNGGMRNDVPDYEEIFDQTLRAGVLSLLDLTED